eukprot:gene12320-5994_t
MKIRAKIFKDATNFSSILKLQQQLKEDRRNNKIPDTFLFLQHLPVITIGRRNLEKQILHDIEELRLHGIDVEKVERGGGVTCHNLGQLVCYPIVKLGENDVKKNVPQYLSKISNTMIKTLKTFEIDSFEGKNDETGIWVKPKKKIGFIGVSFSRWVSMHGFSLNVSNDLKLFEKIIPCGLEKVEITSMEKVLKKQMNMDKVIDEMIKNFEVEFQRQIEIEEIE